MIRFTVRQFRTQAAIALGILAIVAILLAVTGRDLVHLYGASGISTCKAQGNCGTVTSLFLNHYKLFQNLGLVVILLPGIIGIFWGAPLVARELETGTFRLAWTQSVTRSRWLAVKLGLVGLSSVAVAGLFSLMVTWWSSPIDRVNMNDFDVFGGRDLVPIGYAAFAFAVGVTAGLIIRRTVPAMATTLVAFVGARLAIAYWVRPDLMTPSHVAMSLRFGDNVGFEAQPGTGGGPEHFGITFAASPPTIPNAWVYSGQLVDNAGKPATTNVLHQFLVRECPRIVTPPSGRSPFGPGNSTDFQNCLTKLTARFHEMVTYQPADRYWAFQWYETAIFLVLALILVAFCFWWLRRSTS
jgi:hypothetical protein